MDNINEINDQLATLRAKKATIKEMINQLKQEISDRLNVLEASEENTSAEIRKIKQEMSEMMLARKQARPFIRRMNEYLHLLGYHARLSNERAKQIDVLDLESKELYGSYQFKDRIRKFRFKDKNGKRISFSIEEENNNITEKIFYDDVLIECSLKFLKISKYCKEDEYTRKELCVDGDKIICARVKNDMDGSKNGESRYFGYFNTTNDKGISIIENSKCSTKCFSISPNTIWYNRTSKKITDEYYRNSIDSVITFYRNQELIGYLTGEFEKAFPGIKRILKSKSSLYSYIMSANPKMHTSDLTEILNETVDHNCDFPEVGVQKKKV